MTVVWIRENEAELVVELYRESGPIVCLIRVPSIADVETIAQFAFVLRAQLAAEKSGEIIRLDGMNRGARQIFVDGLEVRLLAKDDVGSVFALIYAPVVLRAEVRKIGQ